VGHVARAQGAAPRVAAQQAGVGATKELLPAQAIDGDEHDIGRIGRGARDGGGLGAGAAAQQPQQQGQERLPGVAS